MLNQISDRISQLFNQKKKKEDSLRIFAAK